MSAGDRAFTPLLVERAPAKLNLTLRILARRNDGYSELLSIVAFADLGERLALSPGAETRLEVCGEAGCAPDRNSVIAADRAFRRAFAGPVPEIAYRLDKEIPVAAGLGGGSADAAAALRALAGLCGTDIGDTKLSRIAAEVGADVPACLASKAALITGKGEHVRPLGFAPPLTACLVNPRRALPTASVFARYWQGAGMREVADGARDPPGDAEALTRVVIEGTNDLEAAACACEPAIAVVLAAIRATADCLVARMSGSGATCFGLYRDLAAARRAERALGASNRGWWVRSAELA